MNEDQQLIWKKLQDFELDDPKASLTFTDRLARDNGWPHEFAIRAIIEYKKFIFLIVVTKEPLTPSDEVDQVWHLHLLYTHSYWDDLCGDVLEQNIHHGPTKGGTTENQKFTNWYLRTLEQYVHYFNQEPPKDIWPPHEIRFTNVNFRRVNVDHHWIIKKPFL